jgi:RNA polymerase sigma factor (sigma-70 family)
MITEPMGTKDYLCHPHVDHTLAKIKVGDNSVMNELFIDCRPKCLAWAVYKWHLGAKEAFDCYADAFARFFEHVVVKSEFKIKGCIDNYIIAIMRSLLCKQKKYNDQMRSMPPDISTSILSALDDAIDINDKEEDWRYHQEIWNATEEDWKNRESLFECIEWKLDQLNETCQKLIRYHYYRKMSDREFAERLGISENNVRVKRFRCMESLRKSIDGDCTDQ